MGKGRTRKPGKRTKTGQLSRAGVKPLISQPSAWVKAQQARFGVHYCWAMGRAYVVGILGDGPEALNRYQAAKKFVRLYQRFYGGPAYTCPLDDSPRGGGHVNMDVPDHQEAEKQWLRAAIDSMDVAGVRPYFDQLISTVNVDRGPHWLDGMIGVIDWNSGLANIPKGCARLPKDHHPGDLALQAAAIRALDIIAPEQKPRGILSQRWA